jgi:hypothetical protein
MFDQGIEAGDLRVVFHWCGDRYGHTIERRIDGQWRALLESVEGAPDDLWPPSPPLQSLHIESRPDGPVALLVGMAGKSHWSASVEAKGADGLVFDLACRTNENTTRLGSSYLLLQGEANRCIMLCAGSNETTVRMRTSGEWNVSPLEAERWPTTARWSYSVRAV